MLDFVPNGRARWGFLSHQMIVNGFSWWQGVEASLDVARMTTMIVQEFTMISKLEFMPDMTV